MKVGAGLAMMNPGLRPDEEVYRTALRLADLVEPLGYDSIWTVEHHFTGHSPIPNALQLLTYVAGRTHRIELGTAVVVLPWHNPLRVAEEIAVLDLLSEGRATIGFGRGASVVEYAGFCIPRQEGLARLSEGIDFVIRALTTERFAFDGQFYSCPELALRPRPVHDPARRLLGAAHSTQSARLVGAKGLRLLISPERDRSIAEDIIRGYRSSSLEHGHQPAPPTIHLYVSVALTAAEAQVRARTYMTPMVESLARHYRGTPLPVVTPNDVPQEGDEEQEPQASPKGELSRATEAFMAKHLVGTPDECARRIREFKYMFGADHFIGEFSYGAMPYEEAEQNIRLFAREVLPKISTE
ncbi:LLM class flavin-dependent oxidoreductase [Streptomyces agglomeratus]|uniref:LLM class flavin-dependent oxidoreductase n=1 Tax=Streptomyces agglomeratus TaxID=285458 RepID=UPI00099F57E1|nr:LLM class flavin-dependent oxidoreductase [Streptomyces agglomeratus]